MKALCLNSSLNPQTSSSASLSSYFIQQLQHTGVISDVTVRDLESQPLPALSAQVMSAWSDPDQDDTVFSQASNKLIESVQAHQLIVLAAPLYNFTIASSLKNALDNLTRANITFRYAEHGHEGLLGQDKTVVIIHSAGGHYQDTDNDSVSSYLRQNLNLIGFNDIHQIWAEGLDISPQSREQGLYKARSAIDALVKQLASHSQEKNHAA